jgi:hypothetical protein
MDLYYPIDGPAAPPVVILPSGATGGPQHHAGHASHLASWGFAAAVVHNVPFEDGIDGRVNGARASAALDTMMEADAVRGRLTDRAAVVGTHFNGMSALSASVLDPRFKAVVGLHPALYPYGSDAPDATVPTLILGGNIEGGIKCTYGVTWKVMYLSTGSPHKAEFLFPDARPADFQEPAWDSPSNSCGRPRLEPFPWIRGMLTAWLKYYVQGETEYYEVLYGAGGQPLLPYESSDSIADNAPLGLNASTTGHDGAEITWRSPYTDTTALRDLAIYVSQSGGQFVELDVVPLGTTRYVATGLHRGSEYRYTLAYRDQAGRVFQTADPVSVVGGGPTPTPSATPPPTAMPTPTSTLTPTPTDTPAPNPTATESPLGSRAYLPRIEAP